MKNLLQFLVENIVENPKDVIINDQQEGEVLSLRLQVHPNDLKTIIGKQGKTIMAIRHLLKIKAGRQAKKFTIVLVENQFRKQKGSLSHSLQEQD